MVESQVAARARSIEGLGQHLAALISPEGVAAGLGFQPRPTDVIISPFAKSGTTWLQQIVHGLRTSGHMEFDDISRVVPWIETAHDLELDLDADQTAEPRAFKSHLPYAAVPKGCRYVVSVRDPRDALVSFYRFMENWLFEEGTISIEEFARTVYFARDDGRDYWTHFTSWWEQRDNPDVLLLAFEHMKRDLPAAVRRVAAFLGIEADDALVELVVEQASIEFMLEHKHRFDDLLMRDLSERALGLPPGSDSAKVRNGQVGSHRVELPAELGEQLDHIWRSTITVEHGLGSYESVLEALA